MTQERELSISVNTLAQTEQALNRLDSLESNAQVRVSPISVLNSANCCTPVGSRL